MEGFRQAVVECGFDPERPTEAFQQMQPIVAAYAARQSGRRTGAALRVHRPRRLSLGLQVGPRNEVMSITPGSPAMLAHIDRHIGQYLAMIEGKALEVPLADWLKTQPEAQLHFLITMARDRTANASV